MNVHSTDHLDSRIYLSRQDIPWYQRDWVWGSAALMILCCGLLAGWLLKRAVSLLEERPEAAGLVRLQAVNQQLREQITRLEMVLSGDICNSGGLDDLPVAAPRKSE